MMQVNTTQDITSTAVSFTQNVPQFQCTDNGAQVNTAVFEICEITYIYLFDDHSLHSAAKHSHKYEKNYVFCSFILKTIAGIDSEVRFISHS